VLNATVSLSLTLFIRYALEIGYIHVAGWTAFSKKLPSLTLNIVVDFVLVIILLLYARNRLRKKKHPTKDATKLPAAEPDDDTNYEDLSPSPSYRKPQRYEIPPKEGEGPLKYSHSRRSFSPGPFVLPPDELDDLSIPPYAPIANLRTSNL